MSGVGKNQQESILLPNLKTAFFQVTYGSMLTPFPTGNYRIWSICLLNSDTISHDLTLSAPFPSVLGFVSASSGSQGVSYGACLSLETSPLSLLLDAALDTASSVGVTLAYEEIDPDLFGVSHISLVADTTTLLVTAPAAGVYRSLSWSTKLSWAMGSYERSTAWVVPSTGTLVVSSFINGEMAQNSSKGPGVPLLMPPGLVEGQDLSVRVDDTGGWAYAVWEDFPL